MRTWVKWVPHLLGKLVSRVRRCNGYEIKSVGTFLYVKCLSESSGFFKRLLTLQVWHIIVTCSPTGINWPNAGFCRWIWEKCRWKDRNCWGESHVSGLYLNSPARSRFQLLRLSFLVEMLLKTPLGTVLASRLYLGLTLLLKLLCLSAWKSNQRP